MSLVGIFLFIIINSRGLKFKTQSRFLFKVDQQVSDSNRISENIPLLQEYLIFFSFFNNNKKKFFDFLFQFLFQLNPSTENFPRFISDLIIKFFLRLNEVFSACSRFIS